MVKTGISGLDNLLMGGLKEGSTILIQGSPGTGKTILGIQFIYSGALIGESGLFITSETKADDIRDYAKSLEINLKDLEKKGLFNIMEEPFLRGGVVSLNDALEIIRKKKIKRVVLDSLTLFNYSSSQNPIELRKTLLRLISIMKSNGVTFIATAERADEGVNHLSYESEDFLFDGLIIMFRIRKDATYERCLSVMKMRAQEHSTDIVPISIEKGGIKVFDKEIPFALLEEDKKKK